MSLDSSGSMDWNDPNDIRKDAAKEFVNQLGENDEAAVIDFDSSAKLLSGLTSDKEVLYNAIDRIDSSGGTNIGAGVALALDQVESRIDASKYIIVLTDGEGSYNHSLTQRAIDLGVIIYTIGLGSSVDTNLLQSIAKQTGGKYYHATVASDLNGIFEETANETIDYKLDTDGDGLSDYYEKLIASGTLRTYNGKQLFVDILKPDTDGDGLKDGEEIYVDVSFRGIPYLFVNSYPNSVDSDWDGHGDADDYFPLEKFITPVILLHGRGDNTRDTFGVVTNVYDTSYNQHYNSNTTKKGNLLYEAVETHTIIKVKSSTEKRKPVNLGKELVDGGYSINRNLFAFNYPNEDLTRFNADKLSKYLSNLAYYMQSNEAGRSFYPSKSTRENGEYKVNLIGHSNGGLVSRYFIENLGGSSNVNKLITIDTPHWGSGLADISDNLTTCYPMDIDLNPKNMIFGGERAIYTSLNPWVKKKLKYMNQNQTDELKYWNSGNTEYYFLSGYDIAADKEIPVTHRTKSISFSLDLNGISNFGDFKTQYKSSYINSGVFPELLGSYFEFAFDLKSSDGDNIVNNQSQLGLKFNNDKNSSPLIKRVNADFMWVNIDTYVGHNVYNHFHGLNQHRRETVNIVISCLIKNK